MLGAVNFRLLVLAICRSARSITSPPENPVSASQVTPAESLRGRPGLDPESSPRGLARAVVATAGAETAPAGVGLAVEDGFEPVEADWQPLRMASAPATMGRINSSRFICRRFNWSSIYDRGQRCGAIRHLADCERTWIKNKATQMRCVWQKKAQKHRVMHPGGHAGLNGGVSGGIRRVGENIWRPLPRQWTQLLVDVHEVGPNGGGADGKSGGDFFVRAAFGHQSQDFSRLDS